MIELPRDFQFSQSSMQDFATCPRRFYWRYLQKLRHPAPDTGPLRAYEHHLKQGEQFHRLAEQFFNGLDPKILTDAIDDDAIAAWWADFQAYVPHGVPNARRYPEVALSAPIETPNGSARLTAKFDLIAFNADGAAVIFDWKTGLHKPKRETLEKRLQTVVYRYLLARAGASLNGGAALDVSRIRMTYWFTATPEAPETFAYDAAQYQRDAAQISGLISSLLARENTPEAFPLTDDYSACAFCNYRALCERDVPAGDFRVADMDDEPDDLVSFSISLDQVAEIEF